MKILLTGASGFIGSKLASTLSAKGHEVSALIHKTELDGTSIKKINGDIVEPNLVIPEENYDIVYHLAAVTPLEKNKKTLKNVNYEGTVNFFNKVKNKTKFFVYISGLGVFGEPGDKIINENTSLKPHTEYSKIRMYAQKYLESKCKENSIPFTVAYLGEVYGNGGWFTSQIIHRLKSGKFKMPKSGEFFRNFVHVSDVVNALITIGEKQAVNESFIITDSKPTHFKDFINYTCDLLKLKHPGGIPTILAKAILGGDFVKLLTTSIQASNEKISKLYNLEYPTYVEGLKEVISQINK